MGVTIQNGTLASFTNINAPLFHCRDAGVEINDGNISDTVTGTVKGGTIVSISPSVYSSGSAEYTTTIRVPSSGSWRNKNETIICSGSFATGGYGTPINNSIYISAYTNNSHDNYCNNVGANFDDINQYNQISPGLQRNVTVSNIQVGDRIIGTGNWTAYGNKTAHIWNNTTVTLTSSAYPDPNYPSNNFTTLTVTNVEFC